MNQYQCVKCDSMSSDEVCYCGGATVPIRPVWTSTRERPKLPIDLPDIPISRR